MATKKKPCLRECSIVRFREGHDCVRAHTFHECDTHPHLSTSALSSCSRFLSSGDDLDHEMRDDHLIACDDYCLHLSPNKRNPLWRARTLSYSIHVFLSGTEGKGREGQGRAGTGRQMRLVDGLLIRSAQRLEIGKKSADHATW
jgi:hypothetical protein